MYHKRIFLNISLLALVILLVGVAVGLFRLPPPVTEPEPDRLSFGVHDNRQLVQLTGPSGSVSFQIEDSLGNFLFSLPLKDCVLDCRYRSGRLRFHDNASGRDGYIDSMGYVSFSPTADADIIEAPPLATTASQHPAMQESSPSSQQTNFQETDPAALASDHPFAKEAKKVVSGKLGVEDSLNRRRILSYCEHLRTAYTTKDIDFIRQVFSDDALIIVGHTVIADKSKGSPSSTSERVTYSIRSKQQYLQKLQTVFNSNKSISVEFSGFKIMRHPTMEGIYGVSLRQKYSSDRYSDNGYLFLLWDFRDQGMPLIHVRTWQPGESILSGDDVIDISDFNLQ